MINKILVTPRSLSHGDHPELQRLEKLGYTLVRPTPGVMPNETQLLEAIPGCIGWIAGVEPVSSKVIEHANNLKVISRNGSGVDNLPINDLSQRGIQVKRALGANANGVAELALTLMLAGFRNIPLNDRGIRDGQWPRIVGRELVGSTIGVVGLGAIGHKVARNFLALGARVVGLDPFCEPEGLNEFPEFTQVKTIDDLLSQSHGVTLHLPHSSDEPALLDSVALQKAELGLVIVNTARAGLVNERAMTDALNSGHVSTYATDVFSTEPPEPSALITHENCISTSHIGGLTGGSVRRATEVTVANLLEELEPALA